jgi:hypothetical protein
MTVIQEEVREFQYDETSESSRIETLKKKIDNEEYLYEAIQRIALILSNEILDIPQGGTCHERQWERGK